MSLPINQQLSETVPLKWFPWVCSNAMPDDRIFGLNELTAHPGFGVGPSKIHFEDYEALPDKSYLALAPIHYVIQPAYKISDLDLFLRALNYQADPGNSDGGYVPPLAARLAACLHVLTKSPLVADNCFQPGATELAQKNLSNLLATYPVLMHPAGLHISIRSFFPERLSSFTTPVVSIPIAIALTSYGRFPMAKDGLSEKQLIAFANHRCTKLGLTNRLGPIYGFQPKKEPKKSVFAIGIRAGLKKPELIASLHELSKLTEVTKKRGVSETVPFSYLTDATAYGSFNLEFGNTYAQSFISACGIPNSRRLSPDFLAALGELRNQSQRASEEVTESLKSLVLSSLFGDAKNPRSAPQVFQGVHQVAAGLVTAGIVNDVRAAGTWLRARLHHQNTHPTTNIECATAFIEALEVYGATLDCDELDPIPKAKRIPTLERFGDTPMNPERNLWQDAIRIHAIEKSMKEVIDRSQADPAGSTMLDAECLTDTGTRRRMVKI